MCLHTYTYRRQLAYIARPPTTGFIAAHGPTASTHICSLYICMRSRLFVVASLFETSSCIYVLMITWHMDAHTLIWKHLHVCPQHQAIYGTTLLTPTATFDTVHITTYLYQAIYDTMNLITEALAPTVTYDTAHNIITYLYLSISARQT